MFSKILVFFILFTYTLDTQANRLPKTLEFVTFDFPPLEFLGKGDVPQGIAVEIVYQIFKSLRHPINIQVLPWTRALSLTKKGEVDGIFTAYKNPEREKYLDYSKEVLVPQIVAFYVNRKNIVEFNGDLKSLEKYKIGVTSTISYGQIFDKAKFYLNIERVDNLEHNFKKLISKRIHLVISNIYTADHKLNQLKLRNKIIRLDKTVESVPSYFAFSKKKKHTHLIKKFDEKLKLMKENGSYKKVLEKYRINF